MVLAVAAELMTTVRVDGLLRGVGCPVVFAEMSEEAIRSAISEQQPRVIVLDLGVPAELRTAVFDQARAGGVAVIAFGAHVDTGTLSEARTAGAAEVLTRGALVHGLAPLVAKHLARAGGIAGRDPS